MPYRISANPGKGIAIVIEEIGRKFPFDLAMPSVLQKDVPQKREVLRDAPHNSEIILPFGCAEGLSADSLKS